MTTNDLCAALMRARIRRTRLRLSQAALMCLFLVSCGGGNEQTAAQRAAIGQGLFATEHTIIDRRSGSKVNFGLADKPPANPERNAYFGDLHVHTKYSFDAYAFGTLASPYDAYRFAKGQAIKHPAGLTFSCKRRWIFMA